MSGSISITLVARTDTGLVRTGNEDSVLLGDLDTGETLAVGEVHVVGADGRGPLGVVCDGMGGGEHGGVASQVAAEATWHELVSERETRERVVFARHLRRSIRAANVAVRKRAKLLSSVSMGTTLAAFGIVDRALVLALVGDCRAYIFRRGQLTQVTRDQSVVSALLSAGAITDEEARTSERRHMILQALGPELDVEVALSLVELRRGDTLLVSTDGLHGVLDERYLALALETHADLGKAIARMFELAGAAGAPDNLSAVLAHFDGDGLPECREADEAPRFTEIDPHEDGEAALTSTSRVGKRLAHRAGLREGPATAPIPATGTHAVVTVPTEAPRRGSAARPIGPAERRLAAVSGLGAYWWLVAVAIGALVVFLLTRLL